MSIATIFMLDRGNGAGRRASDKNALNAGINDPQKQKRLAAYRVA